MTALWRAEVRFELAQTLRSPALAARRRQGPALGQRLRLRATVRLDQWRLRASRLAPIQVALVPIHVALIRASALPRIGRSTQTRPALPRSALLVRPARPRSVLRVLPRTRRPARIPPGLRPKSPVARKPGYMDPPLLRPAAVAVRSLSLLALAAW